MNKIVRLALITGCLLAALAPLPAVPPLGAVPAVSGPPVEIPFVTSTTGYLSFLGQANARALDALADVVNNEQGGINGRPVKFVVSDDASSPQLSVELANKIIAANAPVMMGPVITAGCGAIYPLLKKGPVMYCISPIFEPAPNSFGFVSNSSAYDQAVASVRFFRQRGWTRVAYLSTADGSGQIMDRTFDRVFALPENANEKIVSHETFGIGDLSIAGQLAKIRASNPQVVIVWAVGTPFGTALRAMHDDGFNLPILGGNGNMTLASMNQYAASLPDEIYFPGQRSLVRNGAGAGPIRDAQNVYVKALAAHGLKPDLSYEQVWDPALILIDALRHIGPNGTGDQARAYITSLHGFVGINGVYDFRDGSQRGLGLNSVLIARWDPAIKDFIAVTKPSNAR